jgi:hypothetical protein
MDPIGSCSSTKKLGLIGLAYNCGTSSINTIGRGSRSSMNKSGLIGLA